MKAKLLTFALCLAATVCLHVQTNPSPARLPVLNDSAQAYAVAVVMTAKLSGNPDFHVLERGHSRVRQTHYLLATAATGQRPESL